MLLLSADEISDALRAQSIGGRIIYRQTMTSTMDVAQAEIAANAPHGTVVICEQQEHGQGRLSREWVSPVGGVYLSIILYPHERLLPQLTIWASLAVADAIRHICGLKAYFKWPNDVLLHDKKISGIIARSGQNQHGKTWAIVGIGINANMKMSQQTAEIASIATSLSDVSDKEVLRESLIVSLLQSCEKLYNEMEQGEALWHAWQRRLLTLEKSVVVRCGTTVYQGLAESVNSDGTLLLRQDTGEIVIIPAGDVTLRNEERSEAH